MAFFITPFLVKGIETMNELIDHWAFFEPDWYLAMLGKECLSKEILEIFYIARSLFSSQSLYPTKSLLVSLLSRKRSPSLLEKEAKDQSVSPQHKQPLSDHMKIGVIEAISQIATILPRELLIYDKDIIFFKKLINRELNRRDFEAPEDKILSVSDLVYGQDQEVNRAQKVYVLFDNSSSMSGEKMNKLYASKAIALEYLRQVQPENPQIYFRSFTDKVSPLIRGEKTKDIKKIIRHVAHLHTVDCHQTEVGKAILKAVEDIRQDPCMVKAEILVITDGLGPIPKNLRETLGEIKLHVILICGMNVDQILKLYPDRKAWEQGESEDKVREMPAFWDAYGLDKTSLILPDPGETLDALRKSRLTPTRSQVLRQVEILTALAQVYQIQEVVDTFIPLPSILGERFNRFNPFELDLIIEYRKKLEKSQHQDFPLRMKSEVFQRVQFVVKYLTNLLNRKPSKDIQKKIKREIDHFIIIRQTLLKDAWFVSTKDSLSRRGEEMEKSLEREKTPLTGRGSFKGMQEMLILFFRKIGMLFYFVLRLPRPALKNGYDRWTTFLKRRRLIRLQNKLRAELKGTWNL
ncbi:MAG: VWA domain-containing protein [bacterium]